MDALTQELFGHFADPDVLVRVPVRLVLAALVGGVVGLERERTGKAAGLRTHMLVALGSALFVLIAVEASVSADHLTRVIQGVATGIGFLGAGAIIRGSREEEVKGLTTAATIWVTAALGMGVGAGYHWPVLVGVLLTYVILAVLRRLEKWIEGH